jgi:hypothetical protein
VITAHRSAVISSPNWGVFAVTAAWASATTRYLKRCLRRSRSGLTRVTRHFLLSLLLLIRTTTPAATCLRRRLPSYLSFFRMGFR